MLNIVLQTPDWIPSRAMSILVIRRFENLPRRNSKNAIFDNLEAKKYFKFPGYCRYSGRHGSQGQPPTPLLTFVNNPNCSTSAQQMNRAL